MEVLPFSAHLTMTDADPAVAAAAAVQAVALKLPTFLAARPDVWFQQTEAQFALRNITDPTTKYYYLLTALDPVVAERMAGDVAVTPGDGKYDYLKAKLLEVYGLTDDLWPLLSENHCGRYSPKHRRRNRVGRGSYGLPTF